ncbi:BREX system serine/threonine kinase PglW [Frankia sp. AgB32]|nr:BREX system serine/threonine kinase PglW [Frankia sp. AgB32]
MTVTPSQFPHEREALEQVRALLPDAEPYRAWSNFTFTATTGHIREVDLLVIARGGVYLIEIKSLAGRLTASGSNWTQHRASGQPRIFDNPVHLANQKSKELRSLLENANRAQSRSRVKVPFIQPAVFLSNPTLRVDLPANQLHWIFGPASASASGAAGAFTLPSIWSDLLDAPVQDERRRVSPEISKALAKLLPAVGIARSRRHQQVGSWQLEFPAFDSGPTWQDHHAAHAQVASERRRVRIYLVERAAGEAERASREAAARREFEVLHGINHPGIVQVDGLESHEAGPALIFRHRPDELRLDHYLDRYGDRLDAGTRLNMIRQLAEAIAYAHGRRLYHRALAARSVLVVPSGRRRSDEQGWLTPRLIVSDWQAAARDAGSGSSTGVLTSTIAKGAAAGALEPAARLLPHLELASGGYLAPEIGAPRPDAIRIDVFGLGALAYLVLTGQPPADGPNALKARLERSGGLHPAEVVDALTETANDLVAGATHPLPEDRHASVGEFLDWLLLVEDELTRPDPAAGSGNSGDTPATNPPGQDEPEPDPLEAQRGDLLGGEWRVRERLGTGSTSRAFLAHNEKTGHDEVLKIALSDERAARLAHEAAVLRGLGDSRVIRLARPDTLLVGGRTVLVLDHAGEQTVARKLREGRLSVDELETYSDYLFGAVDYLDGEGVVHRDLKPDNIVIRRRPNRTYQLVLIDFSLANHSVRDLAAGTPRYLDPFLGAGTRTAYDDHAERYALAVTLHEMASGELPMWGNGSALDRFTEGPPTLATEAFDPAVRAGLTSFFLRALDRDAASRFPALKDMRDAWQAVFRAADSTPPAITGHPAASDGARATEHASLARVPGRTAIAGVTDEESARRARDAAAAAAAAETPLEAAGLSPRAVSAAHRLNATTVSDLLALGSKEIISLPGTGAKTRQELQSRIRQWRRVLAAAGTTPPPATATATAEPGGTERRPSPDAEVSAVAPDYARLPVEDLAARLLPAALPGGRNATEREATRLLLALPDDDGQLPAVPLWAPQQQVAERVGVTPGRIAQVLSARRKAWHIDDAVRVVRDELVEILGDAGRVMGFEDLATAVLARHGSRRPPAQRRALAAAAVRAALETVDLDSEPVLARRKFHDRTLVALEATEDDSPLTPTAPALFGYAIALGKAADRLAKAEEIPAPATVLRELAAVRAAPAGGGADEAGLAGDAAAAVDGLAGLPALDEQRLVRLAAAASRNAAANARLEIYPRDLGLVRALRLAQAGVLPPRPALIPARPDGLAERPDRPLLEVAVIHERVATRFPALTTELPPHPALDRPLTDAGFVLEWDAARDGYVPPYRLLTSTGLGSRATPTARRSTDTGSRPARLMFDSPDRAAASLAEQRLIAAAESGGFRALTIRRSLYLRARAELALPHRFAAEPVDIAAVFLDALHAEVDPRPRPAWATILRADAAEPGSRAAGNLAEYVRAAWDRAAPLLAELVDAPGQPGPHGPAPLLLHDAGVLGRYDGRGMGLLFALAERARAGRRGVWVLCPTTEPTRPPRLDGALVQVTTESEWVALPDSWAINRHRSGGAEPGRAGTAS